MKGKLSSVKTTETLVEFVRNTPQLYDQSQQGYRDVGVSSKLWNDIAMALDHDVSAEDVRTRWRSLRDNYVRLKRNSFKRKSGRPASQQKQWVFMDMLSFLEPFVQDSSLRDDIDEVDIKEEDGHASINEAPVLTPTTSTPLSAPPETIYSSGTYDDGVPRNKKRRINVNKTSTFETSFSEITNSQTARFDLPVVYQQQRHPVDAFFESCALRAKQMSSSKQAWLQMQVSTLFYNLESSDCLSPNTTSPDPGEDKKPDHETLGPF